MTFFRFALLLLLLTVASPLAATSISNVNVFPWIVARYTKVEITFLLSESYTNPFDYHEVDAHAVITQPDGTQITIPAFYFMQYDLSGIGTEFINNGRNPSWKVRFAPSQPGHHFFDLVVTDGNGTSSLGPAGSFLCGFSDKRGFIRADPDDPRFLAYDDGTAYHPMGRNVGWATSAGTNDYVRWFNAKAATGQNFARIWMTHFFRGQSLEWASSHHTGHYQGLGRYSLPIAARLDRIVELAEERDIAIMLALHHHGQFSTSVNPNWSENPYNIARAVDGGFLSTPQEFFTNPQARELTKRRMRYIIARWGYSTSILCWELFNEVQFTSGFRENATQRAHVAAWHAEMGEWLKQNDPFGHLVSTSSDHAGFEAIWPLPSMEIVQEHEYAADKIRRYESLHAALSAYGKPILFAEFGAPGGTPEFNIGSLGQPYDQQLIDGLVLHNGIWSAALLGSGAMYWWWEYIEQYGHDALFIPLSNFLAGEHFAGKQLQARNPLVLQEGHPGVAIAYPGRTGFWDASGQTEFVMDENGMFPGIELLSQWLHGSYQSALRSNPSFTMTLANEGNLSITVLSVSNAGNNSIQVRVDGATVHSQSLQNGATNFVINVPLPAGHHTIQIVNTGQDWLRIESYGFDDSIVNIARAIALVGPRHAYAWLYDMGSDYGKTPHGLLQDLQVEFADLEDGLYEYEFHHTWTADGIMMSGIAETEDGILRVPVPDFERDLAIKVRPASEGVAVQDLFGIY